MERFSFARRQRTPGRGEDFEFMLDLGADTLEGGDNWLSLVALALETYARNPDGKHRILNALHAAGITLLDTPPMAVHRGRLDCIVTYNAGLRTDRLARLLLERGADPNALASIRKGLAFAKDDSVHEYRDVTPIGWARRFHDPSYVSTPSVAVIEEFGGLP